MRRANRQKRAAGKTLRDNRARDDSAHRIADQDYIVEIELRVVQRLDDLFRIVFKFRPLRIVRNTPKAARRGLRQVLQRAAHFVHAARVEAPTVQNDQMFILFGFNTPKLAS